MAKLNNIHSFIVASEEANLTNQVYTEIIGGNSGCTIIINGIQVEIGAKSSISIWVRSISGGVGCYLGGENIDVYSGSQYLGGANYNNDNNDNNDYIDDYIDDYIN